MVMKTKYKISSRIVVLTYKSLFFRRSFSVCRVAQRAKNVYMISFERKVYKSTHNEYNHKSFGQNFFLLPDHVEMVVDVHDFFYHHPV